MSAQPHDRSTAFLDLFAAGKVLYYKKKELIYRLGDIPSGVYLVRSGVVKVYTLDSGANENIIMTPGPGEVLMLGWAFSDITHDVSIAALTPVEVVRIARQDLLAHCQANHKLTLALLHEMADQTAQLLEHIGNLDYRSARQRIAGRLLYLARQYGRASDGPAITLESIHTSHAHLAGLTHLARETVTRELNQLAVAGVVTRAQNGLTITSTDKLAQVAGVD